MSITVYLPSYDPIAPWKRPRHVIIGYAWEWGQLVLCLPFHSDCQPEHTYGTSPGNAFAVLQYGKAMLPNSTVLISNQSFFNCRCLEIFIQLSL